MAALALVLVAGLALLAAYFTYGRWLSGRVFGLDDSRATPAHTERDDSDYVPTRRSVVFGHHFTSIAGTGPIVGPAIAVMWGWLPALLWVVFGAVFIGAVHDLGSLVVSLRNRGRSIGDIAGDLLGPRARFIFLLILIVGLWIVLAIFGLVIAAVLKQYPAAITPVLIQIPIAVIIGVFIHRSGRSIVVPSIIALAIMYLSVIYGDVPALHGFNEFMAAQPVWIWTVGLLAYCYIASVLPVWVLLQPRDYINALQLVTSLGLITVGLVVAGTIGGVLPTFNASDGVPSPALMPMFFDLAHVADKTGLPPIEGVPNENPLEIVAPVINWQPIGAPPLLPVLFITIACGACSGFHCLVSSGTTSKQVDREDDARPVAYGSMLTEGFLATLVIAACVAGLGLGLPVRADRPGYGVGPHAEFRVADGTVYCVDRYGTVSTDTYDPFEFRLAAERPNTDAFLSSVGVERIRQGNETRGIVVTGSTAFATKYSSWSSAGALASTVGAFVQGAANFIAALGIPLKIAIPLVAVMVAAFAATTLDTACRLQRYVIQELSRTFLPKVDRPSCRVCAYDLSAHVADGGTALRAVNEPGDDTEAREEGKKEEEDTVRRTVPPGAAPPGIITCPECGTEQPASEIYHHNKGARHAAASPINPFKWLATTHGATLFAVVTAFLLAMTPAPGAQTQQAAAGAGAPTLLEQFTGWLQQGGKGGLILWPLFGATNQLLAGFAFVVIAAWLIARRKPVWFIVIPGVFMLAVPASAMVWQAYIGNEANPSWLAGGKWTLVAIATVTLILEAWLLIEVAIRWRTGSALREALQVDEGARGGRSC